MNTIKTLKCFILLLIPATTDLLDIFDLEEDMHYCIEVDKKNNYIPYYKIFLDTRETNELYDLIKDINIYMPRAGGIYLSDYLFMKKPPIKEILNLMKEFTVDQIFAPFFIRSRIVKISKKYS